MSGPRVLLCLLPEMTVVCVERGHPPAPPFLVLPPAFRDPAVCRARGLGRAREGEEQQSFVVLGLAAAGV